MPHYAITELHDLEQIREFLLTDPAYAAYALADLEPPAVDHTRWFAAARTGEIEGLALVFEAAEPQILFLMGEPPALSALLVHGIGPDKIAFAAPNDMTDILTDFYQVDEMLGMFRMRITSGIFNPYLDPASAPAEVKSVELDEAADVRALLDLTSEEDGRDPQDVFFEPKMLLDGYFRGLRIDGKLVAVAGTHIVSKPAGVATLGNVAVHPDHRRQGFGGLVTQATTQALLDDDYELIVLNVRQNNQAANKIYRRLGYKPITPYIEGIAERY